MDESNLNLPQSCAFTNLRMASRAITHYYDDVLQPSGLRATQFALLVAISKTTPTTITRLAEKMVMDRTTLTRNLKPLEKQGLLVTTPGKDQRTRLVTLTGQGQEALTRALPLWEKAQAHVLQELGPERLRTLLANLADVVSLTR